MRTVKQPLGRVLALLRLIRDAGDKSSNSFVHILTSAVKVPYNSPAFYRLIALTLENLDDAEQALLAEARFDDEGRAGLLHAVKQLRVALNSNGLGHPAKNLFPNIDLIIAQFSLVSRFVQEDAPLSEEGEEALASIDEELTALYASVNGAEIDAAAKKAVLANITALQVLIRNTDLFGFDGAKSAYVDLLSMILKQIEKTDEKTSNVLANALRKVEDWAKRITLIHSTATACGKIAGAGVAALRLVSGG